MGGEADETLQILLCNKFARADKCSAEMSGGFVQVVMDEAVVHAAIVCFGRHISTNDWPVP